MGRVLRSIQSLSQEEAASGREGHWNRQATRLVGACIPFRCVPVDISDPTHSIGQRAKACLARKGADLVDSCTCMCDTCSSGACGVGRGRCYQASAVPQGQRRAEGPQECFSRLFRPIRDCPISFLESHVARKTELSDEADDGPRLRWATKIPKRNVG